MSDLDDILKKFEQRKSEEASAVAIKAEQDKKRRIETIEKLNLMVLPEIDSVARRLIEAGHKAVIQNRLQDSPHFSVSLEMMPRSETDSFSDSHRKSKLTMRCYIPEIVACEEKVYSYYGQLEHKKVTRIEEVSAEWATNLLVSFVEKALRYG